jgi:DMSO/TMAO reductase YedYZ heme-binding membrane subunit
LGFQFYAGCRQIRDVTNVLQQNYDLLRVQEGLHPQFPNHPRIVTVIEAAVRESADKTGRWTVRQFRFLVAGAVFYVLWHVTEMALRTQGFHVPFLSYF